MADLVIPTDSKTALYTVCLFLAQSGDAHLELGYKTKSDAFKNIGSKFGVPKNSVRNVRDVYDRFTDSNRVGWDNGELPQRFKVILDKYTNTTREELRDISLKIMNTNWEQLEQRNGHEMKTVNQLTEAPSNSKMPVTLPDLEECQRLSKDSVARIPIDEICTPSSKVWEQILELYSVEAPTDKAVIVGNASISIITDKNKFFAISAQELPRCWAVRPYVLGILKYEEKVDELAEKLDFPNRRSGRGKEEIFKKLPSKTWETDLSAQDVTAIKEAIKHKLALNEKEQQFFLRFLADPKWSGVSKTLERNDWTIAAIVAAGDWLANASDRRGELSIALAKSAAFEELVQIAGSDTPTIIAPLERASVPTLKGGENVIFYGAPGTGKSNRINEKIKQAGKRPFRTVFHPDLQHSDFFGCLKPHMKGDNVRYDFSPGPFMKVIAEAYRTPKEPVFLVIEELNRAAAAAVFGDLFLLLDRDDDGKSEYDVSFPSPESEIWFKNETGTDHKSLQLPSNLFIYATMNSADQGVYPLDTAFRRRWHQVYLPLDYEKGPRSDISYIDATGKQHSLSWREFAKLLKDHLTGSRVLNIAEDRLIGQWFVKHKELDGTRIPEKVLLYLWDDLLRHEGREEIFDSGTTGKVKTYGDLVIEASEGRRFLSDRFLAVLNAASEVQRKEPEGTVTDAG